MKYIISHYSIESGLSVVFQDPDRVSGPCLSSSSSLPSEVLLEMKCYGKPDGVSQSLVLT